MEYKNGALRLWIGFKEKLKRIVESKYFNRGIMIAILVNTLSMGIEYHQQVRGRLTSCSWIHLDMKNDLMSMLMRGNGVDGER